MQKIGKDGEIKRHEYFDWPLFTEFRKSDAFKKAYKKIFGKEGEVLDITQTDMTADLSSDGSPKDNMPEANEASPAPPRVRHRKQQVH